VFCFDRHRLQTRYRLFCAHDPFWDEGTYIHDEMEERIWCGIDPLDRYLDDVVFGL
jgi:hypothetical protein